MKKILVCLLVFAAQVNTVSAQPNMSKFIPDNMFPLLNANDILDVKFQWNMKGKLQASLNEGINNLREGNFGPASHDLDEVILQDSTLWVGYYYRGIAKKNLHKLEESGSDFLRSQRLAPTVAEPFFELGLLYQDFRQFTLAKKEYEKALILNPKLVQARYSLGGILLMTRDMKGALKQYQRCNEMDPTFAAAYMAQGILKFKARKNDNESIVWFNKALAVDSTLSNAYFWRGLAYSSLNQQEKCLPDWNNAVRYNPINSFLLMMRGYLLTHLDKFDEAFSDFRKSISFDDSNFSMQQLVLMDKDNDVRALMKYLVGNGYGLAPETFDMIKKSFCLLLARRYSESLQSAEAAQARGTNACIYFLKGTIYDRNDRPDLAFPCYNSALELDNDIFEAHKKRGQYFAIKNDWTRANLDVKEMARIDPTSTAPMMPFALIQRGRMKFDQHDYVGTILDLTEFLNAVPSAWDGYFLRADARIHLGDFVTANEDLQRVASHMPNNLVVQKTLADNCLMINDTLCALSAYRICAKMIATPTMMANRLPVPPVFYEIHFGLAHVYTEMKRWSQADAQLDTIRKVSTNADFKVRTDMHYYRGKLEYSMANYTKAIYQFEDVMKSEPGNFDAQYYMAKAAQALGQKQRAKTLFKRINGYLDSGELYESLSK